MGLIFPHYVGILCRLARDKKCAQPAFSRDCLINSANCYCTFIPLFIFPPLQSFQLSHAALRIIPLIQPC